MAPHGSAGAAERKSGPPSGIEMSPRPATAMCRPTVSPAGRDEGHRVGGRPRANANSRGVYGLGIVAHAGEAASLLLQQ